MNNYDVEMFRGGSHGYENIRIRLETGDRQLLDAVMSAIDQTYDAWFTGRLAGNGLIKVEVV